MTLASELMLMRDMDKSEKKVKAKELKQAKPVGSELKQAKPVGSSKDPNNENKDKTCKWGKKCKWLNTGKGCRFKHPMESTEQIIQKTVNLAVKRALNRDNKCQL